MKVIVNHYENARLPERLKPPAESAVSGCPVMALRTED